jgi:preprotein translocase subunit SecA
LHQAIEAKEKVKIQRESQTMATITFQNYFRMYEKLSGMTGTAVTEAEEFGKIYKLEVVVVPSHRAKRRIDHQDKIYKTHDGKFKAIAKHVKELQLKGQPVLIGTVSVVKNEMLAQYLEMEGVKFEVLNAKNHEREGEIVAQAGRPGAVTLATNMAGRGVDIILGGNPPVPEDAEKVRSLGGLFVIGTERHESRRIDNQLRGRAGRQGDPGETLFYLSTEDDLMRIFAGDRIKAVMQALKVPDDMPIEQKTISRIIESAQKKVEGFHFDTRKHLLEYDDVLNRHREVIYGNRKKLLETYRAEREAFVSGKPLVAGSAGTLRAMIFAYLNQEIEQVVSLHTNGEDKAVWNTKEIIETIKTIFPLTTADEQSLEGVSGSSDAKLGAAELRTALIEKIVAIAKVKYDELIVTPTNHPELLIEIEKQVLLRSIDTLWIEHLVAIDYLRTGIGLRGYGQRDPLVEYKKETFHMFNELMSLIQKEVVYTIFKVSVGIQLAPTMMEAAFAPVPGQAKVEFSGAEGTTDVQPTAPALQAAAAGGQQKEVGRNDLCYCGSGKKFKKCHGN